VPLDVDLVPLWSLNRTPTLVIRGASSDLLLPETFAQMQDSGAQAHEVPDAGHAPALMDAETIGVIRQFLLAGGR
jgi:pimeloyl-ACP methyl ester carboxylesterase